MFYLLACNRDIQEAVIRSVRVLDDVAPQVMFPTSNIIEAKRANEMMIFVVTLLLCFFIFVFAF